jgi:CBS domain-containing protein
MPKIDRKSAIFFANQLRSARLAALADAEAFDEIIHAVERLGSYLNGKLRDLGGYRTAVTSSDVAGVSGLTDLPDPFRTLFTPFAGLYDLVTQARNDALHQGAFARHLTKHAIELAIVLEDALSTYFDPVVSDFMVRDPVCAELWQPLGFIRQRMLANSYSYLPARGDDEAWLIVSDAAVARFLRLDRNGGTRKMRLAVTLRDASQRDSDLLERAQTLPPGAEVREALERLSPKGVLLVIGPDGGALLGILTAFDLL